MPGHLCTRIAFPLLVLLSACKPTSANVTTGATGTFPMPKTDSPHVVLVSIDGMRADYCTNADAYGLKIPTLRSLMARGRYAEGMTSVFPTVTFPAHTTMVTGKSPERHGITSNLAFDPWMQNAGGWNWYAESIRGDTLWSAAHRAGLSVGAIFWPVTVGADLDFNVPQVWRQKIDEDWKLLRAVSSPGFAAELEQNHVALPAENRSDEERAAASAYLLRVKKPGLSLLYFGDLDSEQHRSGPGSRETLATLEAIDARLAKVIQATVDAGTFAHTTFVIVSDHGFLPVSTEIRPAAWLIRAGLVTRGPDGHVREWKAAALPAGGVTGIALHDPESEALAMEVETALRDLAKDPANGIAKVDTKKDLQRLEGFDESTFALEAAAGFEFVSGADEPAVRPSAHRGTHGYSPEIAEMRASFIIAGPTIHPGARLPLVRMIDVAPTVAQLLGLSLPEAEGKPISGLF